MPIPKGMILNVDVWCEWKCLVCGKREPMKTEDGNEDWAFCCSEPMRMQPMRKYVIQKELTD